MRTCPVCHRKWVPLSSDPPDKQVCNTCRLGIHLLPPDKKKEAKK